MRPCDVVMAMYPSAKWLTIADELHVNFSSMFMFESVSQALLFLHSDGVTSSTILTGHSQVYLESQFFSTAMR